jgi:hypothetical protein
MLWLLLRSLLLLHMLLLRLGNLLRLHVLLLRLRNLLRLQTLLLRLGNLLRLQMLLNRTALLHTSWRSECPHGARLAVVGNYSAGSLQLCPIGKVCFARISQTGVKRRLLPTVLCAQFPPTIYADELLSGEEEGPVREPIPWSPSNHVHWPAAHGREEAARVVVENLIGHFGHHDRTPFGITCGASLLRSLSARRIDDYGDTSGQ